MTQMGPYRPPLSGSLAGDNLGCHPPLGSFDSFASQGAPGHRRRAHGGLRLQAGAELVACSPNPVATDSDEVIEACHAHHIPAVLTSAEHRSGTDRLWEVLAGPGGRRLRQHPGDEPLVTTGHIETLVRPFLQEP
jgi:hypothetical protein